MNTITQLTAGAICALALTACGGGGDGGGSASPSGSSYTVTPSVSGTGGAISPATPVSVNSGATTVFTLTPNANYTASVGGTCGGTLSGNTYTTQAITANCTVVATFAGQPPTPVYEGLTSATDATSFLSQLSQEGAKGYRYLYDASFDQMCTDIVTIDPNGDTVSPSCGPFPPPVSVFVNDGTAPSYSYMFLPNPGNVTDLITQANTEGAQGYQYVGSVRDEEVSPSFSYVVYRKDDGSAATYTYVADTAGPMASIDAFLSQTDAHGQSGYWFYGRIGQDYPTPANLYVKNNASNATYAYDAQTLGTTTDPAYVAQINNEGINGYRPIYTLTPNTDIPESDLFAMLYIKDQTQSTIFTFQSVTPVENGAGLIAQLNGYGAQGYATWSWNPAIFLYYFKAANCSGWLCTTF
jgi:hypothetical protein